MPKSKNSPKAQPPALPDDEAEIPSQQEESTSSDQESDAECHFMQTDCKPHHNFLHTCSCLI